MSEGLRSREREFHVSFVEDSSREERVRCESNSSLSSFHSSFSSPENEASPKSSFWNRFFSRLSVPSAFKQNIHLDDDYEDVERQEIDRRASCTASGKNIDQLTSLEREILNELIEESREQDKQKRRLDNAVQYPMSAMQQATNGLMGGFSIGCVTPIYSSTIHWKDLWFVAQDILLLVLYGLAVSME